MTESGRWREVRREPVADCRVFEVERSIAKPPRGESEHDFYRVVSRDWVQIVPVTANDEIVMVRQYRHGSSEIVLEIPGGMVDAGEAPAAAAARECLEETGYAVGTVRALGDLNPNPAIHNHRLHAFFATDVTRVAEIQTTATEHTEVELVPVGEVRSRLLAGGIDHALVVATLWRFLHEIGEGC